MKWIQQRIQSRTFVKEKETIIRAYGGWWGGENYYNYYCIKQALGAKLKSISKHKWQDSTACCVPTKPVLLLFLRLAIYIINLVWLTVSNFSHAAAFNLIFSFFAYEEEGEAGND